MESDIRLTKYREASEEAIDNDQKILTGLAKECKCKPVRDLRSTFNLVNLDLLAVLSIWSIIICMLYSYISTLFSYTFARTFLSDSPEDPVRICLYLSNAASTASLCFVSPMSSLLCCLLCLLFMEVHISLLLQLV